MHASYTPSSLPRASRRALRTRLYAAARPAPPPEPPRVPSYSWPARAVELLDREGRIPPKALPTVREIMAAPPEVRTVGALARRIYLSPRALARRMYVAGVACPRAWLSLAECLCAIEEGVRGRLTAGEASKRTGFPSDLGLTGCLHYWTGLRPSEVLPRPDEALETVVDAWSRRHLPGEPT